MTTKHTPGPWIAEADPEDLDFFSVWTDTGKGSDAEIAGRIGEKDNAALIAAAPDLLVALKAVEDQTSHSAICARREHPANECTCIVSVIYAAIAKAEGRSAKVEAA